MGHPGAVDTPLWRHVSSATGKLPRTPPDRYAPEVMAGALVACAIRPRAEITVGGEGRADGAGRGRPSLWGGLRLWRRALGRRRG